MEWLALLVVALLVLLVIVGVFGREEHYPYTRNPVLFSPAERSFLGVLEQAVGAKYRVFGKVRVADVVSAKRLSNRRRWQRAFNRISAKHFDFVLCGKDDLSIIAVVELDDKSHGQRKRRERDRFLAGLCEAVSLPLLQIPAKRAYSVAEVRATLQSALSAGSGAGTDQPLMLEKTSPMEEPAAPRSEAGAHVELPQSSPLTDTPQCPKCMAAMVRRKVKSGAKAGQEFWGCSTFPKCRAIK